jgi:hypothetical protein
MPIHIKQLLPNLLPKEQSWKINLLEQWRTIVGNLKAHVTLLKITDDTITLGVFNSSWLQEMYLLSPFILDTINKSIDQPRIKQIRFKQIAQTKKSNQHVQSRPTSCALPLALTKKERAALVAVNDPELRVVLEQFLQRCNRENR